VQERRTPVQWYDFKPRGARDEDEDVEARGRACIKMLATSRGVVTARASTSATNRSTSCLHPASIFVQIDLIFFWFRFHFICFFL
jgi:hypothetical protein